jgi:hypothetical protein
MTNVINLIKSRYYTISTTEDSYSKSKYFIIPANPATGILFVTQDNPQFISGHVRVRGRGEGRYPYRYLEMIDTIFGKEDSTIEVCSHSVKSKNGHQGNKKSLCFTVDINPKTCPDLVADGQKLDAIPNSIFNRWRCDPPYNEKTAEKMYRTTLPVTGELLKAASRVCRVGSLLFLLLGPQNYQWCPAEIKRIGWVAMTIVPNNELRALHIYYKYS